MSLPTSSTLAFSNRYADLPETFFCRVAAEPLPSPRVIAHSPSAAALLGLSANFFTIPHAADLLCGNRMFDGSVPIATVYSGHQFGVWAGQLGDGRAILLGDVASAKNSEQLEVQLKGSGHTPYSRFGDGRAVLRSSIREFLCSEAMHGLGIPTTRALSIVASPQPVIRETAETAAVVTRVAPSFIRFGTFEHFYARRDESALRTLADFVIAHHYPELAGQPRPYQALLREVCRRSARLIAQWQAVGFMHGVMNTDNMSILGLTLDYGPFGFMESFDPKHICNHSDTHGRYAFDMQPAVGQWNCEALAQALLPLLDSLDDAQEALATYPDSFYTTILALMRAKLGLTTTHEGDDHLIQGFLNLLHRDQADYTLNFRALCQLRLNDPVSDQTLRDLVIDHETLSAWLADYRQRLRAENSIDEERRNRMLACNPKYVLRNYLAQIAIEKSQQGDDSEIQTLLHILAQPYSEQPEYERYAALPPDWARHVQLSCSS